VEFEWSQVSALGVLAAGAAILIVLALGLVSLVRRLGRWIAGGTSAPEADQSAGKPADPVIPDPIVTASDLFAVRSNLNAVARQLEDLESRLRLHPPRR
jgi:hypothetical protein